jgi:hypothetical protein
MGWRGSLRAGGLRRLPGEGGAAEDGSGADVGQGRGYVVGADDLADDGADPAAPEEPRGQADLMA